MEFMFYSPIILLTPHRYLEWKPNILLLLRSRGLYQITMEMEVEPDFTDEKNEFFDKQDMAIGFIFLSISQKFSTKYMMTRKNQLQMNYGPNWRFYLGINKIVKISCRRLNR
jgi:hypothetical protein